MVYNFKIIALKIIKQKTKYALFFCNNFETSYINACKSFVLAPMFAFMRSTCGEKRECMEEPVNIYQANLFLSSAQLSCGGHCIQYQGCTCLCGDAYFETIFASENPPTCLTKRVYNHNSQRRLFLHDSLISIYGAIFIIGWFDWEVLV